MHSCGHPRGAGAAGDARDAYRTPLLRAKRGAHALSVLLCQARRRVRLHKVAVRQLVGGDARGMYVVDGDPARRSDLRDPFEDLACAALDGGE